MSDAASMGLAVQPMKSALKWRLENHDEMGGYRTSPLDWFYDDVSANTDTLFNQLSKSCRACV